MDMKKVLIVSYNFPPCIYIGSQRPYRLSKSLPASGWEPVILTTRTEGERLPGCRVIETDYDDVIKSLKSKLGFDRNKSLHDQVGIDITKKEYAYPGLKSKFIKFFKEIVALPDDRIGWYKHAVKSASELMRTEKIDALITTSYPETAHLVGRALKKEFNVPWVADLRDLWTQNHYYGKYPVVKYIEEKIEARTLSFADTLVTVSEPLAAILRSFHRNKKVVCVTNGYDDDDFPEIKGGLTDKFTITYTGTLYTGRRDPSSLFRAVRDLIAEGKIKKERMEIRFFVERDEWLHKEAARYGLEDVVAINGFVPRPEALRMQQESQALLLLLWDNPKEEGVYTGKLFEYLGSRRPIIAVGGTGGVVRELLETTGAGRFAADEGSLKDVLWQYYREYSESGEVKSKSNSTIGSYSYRSIARKYSEVLDEIV